MDFLQEISGPQGPYMDVFIANRACKVQNLPFEKENDKKCPNSDFCRKIQKFKIAISTISACPNPKIRFFLFLGVGGALLTGGGGHPCHTKEIGDGFG